MDDQAIKQAVLSLRTTSPQSSKNKIRLPLNLPAKQIISAMYVENPLDPRKHFQIMQDKSMPPEGQAFYIVTLPLEYDHLVVRCCKYR